MAMYQIECAYTCHTGNIRANNEDNFWCFGESLLLLYSAAKILEQDSLTGLRKDCAVVLQWE